ncbi:MAG: L,D-transpeptidase family protein [Raoultibacter sp.]
MASKNVDLKQTYGTPTGKHARPHGESSQFGPGNPQKPSQDFADQQTGVFRSPLPTGAAQNAVPTSNSGGKNPRDKGLKIVGIVTAVIVGLLLLVYLAVSIFFFSRFWPNTTVADIDLSTMSASDAQSLITSVVSDYSLEVKGEGLSFTLTAADAGVSVDSSTLVANMLKDVNPWAWPFEITKHHDESSQLTLTSTDAGLNDTVTKRVEAFNAGAAAPQNATIAYTEAVKAFTVVPEVAGTTLSLDAVLKMVDDAVGRMLPSVHITKKELNQPTVTKDTPQIQAACVSANKMISAQMRFVMAGTPVSELGSAQIAPYVRLQDDLTVKLDDGFLTEWSDKTAGACNTYGSTRTYTRPDGKVISVTGGVYGWLVDKDALRETAVQGIAAGKQGDVDVPVTQSAAAFNGAGAQDWGPRYVDVDLSEQQARFYDGSGALIWSAAFVSGKPDGEHATPTGVFVVNGMESPSTLIGSMMPATGEPEYKTKVDYWMPFVGNAVGFHDANWQSSFGGTRYADGYGSHGCVNLSPGDAAALYSTLSVGDVVVSHN